MVGGEPVLERMLASVEPFGAVEVGTNEKFLAFGASLLIAASGIFGAAAYYSPRKLLNPAVAARRFGWAYQLFAHKWWFDEIYEAVLIRPVMRLASAVAWFDRNIVDGLVNFLGSLTVGLSRFEGFFDRFAVDGLVSAVANLVYFSGDQGRKIQTGRLRNYLGILAVAVVGLFAGMFYWISA